MHTAMACIRLTRPDKLTVPDREAIDTVQEVFGYCLTADTRQQKAFMLIGPKRSGKGTIARVLTHLVGLQNTVAPTLAGLGMNFGMAPLIGKRVAIVRRLRVDRDGHRGARRKRSRFASYTDLRKFLDRSVSFISGHGSIAGTTRAPL